MKHFHLIRFSTLITIIVFLGAVIYAFNLHKPALIASAQQMTTIPTSTAAPSLNNSGNATPVIPPGATNAASQIVISPSEILNSLIQVGFSNVKQETETPSGRFKTPPYYFEVSDRVDATSSEASNIVMVYIYNSPDVFTTDTSFYTYGSDSHSFTIIGGVGKEGTMFDNRIVVNFTKGSTYVVVIGPNKQKIEGLAILVAQEIQ